MVSFHAFGQWCLFFLSLPLGRLELEHGLGSLRLELLVMVGATSLVVSRTIRAFRRRCKNHLDWPEA